VVGVYLYCINLFFGHFSQVHTPLHAHVVCTYCCVLNDFRARVGNGIARPAARVSFFCYLTPRGEVCPLGLKLAPGGEDPLFAPPFFGRVVFTPGVNERVNIAPREQRSPLGAKFTHRGKLKLLKTGLWVASRYIFIPKILIWICFRGPWNGECSHFYARLEYFMVIWYILLPFGTFWGHLVHFGVIWYILGSFGTFWGHLVYFSTFCYVVPRKILQPKSRQSFYRQIIFLVALLH
jgi:hypothetical protein